MLENPHGPRPERDDEFARLSAAPALSIEKLRQAFRDYCAELDLQTYAVANEPIAGEHAAFDIEERMFPHQEALQCRKFVNDFVASIDTFGATGHHGSLHPNIEGTARGYGGPMLCLIDALDSKSAKFYLPTQPEALLRDGEKLPPVRMPAAFEMLGQAAGLLGSFESKHWEHASVKFMFTSDAFAQAVGKALEVSSYIEGLRRDNQSLSLNQLPDSSLLVSIGLNQSYKAIRAQEAEDALFSGIDPSEMTPRAILGLNSLRIDESKGCMDVELIVLDASSYRKEGGILLSGGLLRSFQRVKIEPDRFGILTPEVVDFAERPAP